MTDQNSSNLQYCTLNQSGVIRVSGDDAETFLQGQFGNDLSQLDEETHQLNCYSNPKGRLLAIFRLFRIDGQFYLRMPREIIEPTLKRLSMFVLMAKVTIDDVSDDFSYLGITGAGVADALAELGDKLPKQAGSMQVQGSVAIMRVPGANERYEVCGPNGDLSATTKSLAKHAVGTDNDSWAYDDLLAGIPTIFKSTTEEFVAQMVNLQLIEGLSFKKGCYPGQEIIARMHYLGKLKRRMYLLRLDQADSAPEPGTDLFAGNSQSSIGKIVDARAVSGRATRALAVITIAVADEDSIRVGAEDDCPAVIEPLPYPFEIASDS